MVHVFQLINSAFVLCIVWVMVSDDAQFWLKLAFGIYAFVLVAFGVFILNAKRIEAWCDKKLQEAKDDNDKNAP